MGRFLETTLAGADDFLARNLLVDHGYVRWSNRAREPFPLRITHEGLRQHGTPFEYVLAKLLEHLPERSREEIRQLWFGGELWELEDGLLIDTVTVPF